MRREVLSGLCRRAKEFTCRVSVEVEQSAQSNSASVSGESVASISVGMTDCQAVHEAAACLSSAEPTPTLPMRSGRWNNGEVTSLTISMSKLIVSASGTKVMRKTC